MSVAGALAAAATAIIRGRAIPTKSQGPEWETQKWKLYQEKCIPLIHEQLNESFRATHPDSMREDLNPFLILLKRLYIVSILTALSEISLSHQALLAHLEGNLLRRFGWTCICDP